MKKILLIAVLAASTASAATFNLFSPANGLLKGNATTYVTTSAVASDVYGLWGGTCTSSTPLRGDGQCGAIAQSSVTNLTTDLANKAPLASPALTGTPTAPTAATGTNTTQLATTAGIVAERTATATLTNKTISGASNTLTNIADASLSANVPLLNANNTRTGVDLYSLAEPRLRWSESDQGTDLKAWDWDINGGVACFRTRTDADATGQNVWCATRGTTTSLTNMTFGYATAGTYTFAFTGATAFSGTINGAAINGTYLKGTGTGSGSSSPLAVVNAAPYFGLRENDQGTDGGNFDIGQSAGVVTFGSINDANSTRRNAFSFTRGNTSPDISVINIGNATNNAPVNFLGTGTITAGGPVVSGGTKFTASGCSLSATVGGVQAGRFTSGTTGTCTVTITLPTAPNGWTCVANDITTPVVFTQTAQSTTGCTVSGTTVTGDIVSFLALGY